jgi:CheY-like chemotaxis protein
MTENSILFISGEEERGRSIQATLSEVAPGEGTGRQPAVTRVDSLFDGLRTLQDGSFDLIVADLNLPDSQGIQTVKHLRQDAPQTPVIVLCSTADREAGIAAVRLGAHDFFCHEELDPALLRRSVNSALSNGEGEASHSGANRRTNVRFPVRLAVNYQALESPFFSGSAVSETVNISSKGVLFATQHPLQPGQLLQVSVDWPARLENEIPLKLVAEGRVIRVVDGQAAVKIEKYEFRTRRVRPADADAAKTAPAQTARPK